VLEKRAYLRQMLRRRQPCPWSLLGSLLRRSLQQHDQWLEGYYCVRWAPRALLATVTPTLLVVNQQTAEQWKCRARTRCLRECDMAGGQQECQPEQHRRARHWALLMACVVALPLLRRSIGMSTCLLHRGLPSTKTLGSNSCAGNDSVLFYKTTCVTGWHQFPILMIASQYKPRDFIGTRP